MTVSNPTPTEVVTVTLGKHFGFPNYGGLLDCACGAVKDRTISEHSAHQAAAVLAALNLTEEWNVLTDMGVKSHAPLTEERAKGLAERFEDMTARRRLVGPWLPVGDTHAGNPE